MSHASQGLGNQNVGNHIRGNHAVNIGGPVKFSAVGTCAQNVNKFVNHFHLHRHFHQAAAAPTVQNQAPAVTKKWVVKSAKPVQPAAAPVAAPMVKAAPLALLPEIKAKKTQEVKAVTINVSKIAPKNIKLGSGPVFKKLKLSLAPVSAPAREGEVHGVEGVRSGVVPAREPDAIPVRELEVAVPVREPEVIEPEEARIPEVAPNQIQEPKIPVVAQAQPLPLPAPVVQQPGLFDRVSRVVRAAYDHRQNILVAALGALAYRVVSSL